MGLESLISRPTPGKTLATGTTEFAYDPNGHLLSEQSTLGTSGRDYVCADTSPLAQINTAKTDPACSIKTRHYACMEKAVCDDK
jgi:YD repeat-containing protein